MQRSSLFGNGVWGSRREQRRFHWKVRQEPRAGAEETFTRQTAGAMLKANKQYLLSHIHRGSACLLAATERASCPELCPSKGVPAFSLSSGFHFSPPELGSHRVKNVKNAGEGGIQRISGSMQLEDMEEAVRVPSV